MTLSRLGTLVSTSWLHHQLLATKNAGLRVLDSSWVPEKSVDGHKEFYLKKHIPRALYFDLHRCVESTPLIPRNLPDANCFTDYVRSLGVGENTHVITYDQLDSKAALRTWWLFRVSFFVTETLLNLLRLETIKLFGHCKVSILDGGLRRWIMDGFEITDKPHQVEQKSQFQSKFNANLLRDFDAMMENLHMRHEQVVDARPENHFRGAMEIPNPDMNKGHIPQARNIPFGKLFHDDGTFKSEAELKELFDGAAINLENPLVAMCQTGMTACGLAAAAHILGKNTVPVYYGSWNEWSQRAAPEMCHRIQ